MLKSSLTGKINSRLGRADKWLPAVFFLFVLTLYLTMLLDGAFVDETDVFYGGYSIIKGGDLYKVYPSQHMPFSYYFSAIIALFGAREESWFRVGFYVMLSGLWTGIYIRYRKHIPRLALIMLPVLYITQLKMYSLATRMLSDHWQGIGLVIILLELIRYAEEKKIPIGSACMISLGIILSFGTTFLSAYSLAAVLLGVAGIQITMLVKKERPAKEVLTEDARLVLICLAPFALLAAWYAATGNLSNAIGGAYRLNTEIYSKYLGGFGTSPGSTFLGVFPGWISYVGNLFGYVKTWPTGAVLIFAQTASLIWLVVSFVRDKKIIAAVAFTAAIILSGVRGFDNFHGLAFLATISIPMALCFDGALSFFAQKKEWKRAAPAVVCLTCLIALVTPQLKDFVKLIYVPNVLDTWKMPESNREIIEVLTDPEERIHTGDIGLSAATVMRNNLRLDEGTPAISNPWFYEYYGERELAALKENQTKLIYLDPEGEVWGYYVKDYAADFIQYLKMHYTQIGERRVWIRNEDYNAAIEQLNAAGYGETEIDMPGAEPDMQRSDMMENHHVLEQRFVAQGNHLTAIRVMTLCSYHRNRAGLTVSLTNPETGEVLGTATLGQKELTDGGMSRFAMSAETEPGKVYNIRITTDGTVPEGWKSGLLICHYAGGAAGETAAYVNGEKQDYNWSVRIEYTGE